MIRILTLAFVGFVFCNGIAEAKYNPPKDKVVKSRSAVTTDKVFYQVNNTKDGNITLEQWKSRATTADSRRQERREKKDGTYLTPEEKFKAMDADGDGIVTKEEMEKYIRSIRDEGKVFY